MRQIAPAVLKVLIGQIGQVAQNAPPVLDVPRLLSDLRVLVGRKRLDGPVVLVVQTGPGDRKEALDPQGQTQRLPPVLMEQAGLSVRTVQRVPGALMALAVLALRVAPRAQLDLTVPLAPHLPPRRALRVAFLRKEPRSQASQRSLSFLARRQESDYRPFAVCRNREAKTIASATGRAQQDLLVGLSAC